MRPRIKLPDHVIRHAEAEALSRHEASRAAGVVDRQLGRQSSAVTDIVGLLGEVAFSKLFGLDRDDTVGARSGTVDFVARNGQAIEVKSSHHDNPHLLVPAYLIGGIMTTKEQVDVYVLMRIEYNDRAVTFMGWAERADVIRDDRLEYFRGAPRQSFVLPPDELRQLDPDTARSVASDAMGRGEIVELT